MTRSIRGAGDLLKLQPHLGNAGQPGLETEVTVATSALFTFHKSRQWYKNVLQWTFRPLRLLNELSGIFFPTNQFFR